MGQLPANMNNLPGLVPGNGIGQQAAGQGQQRAFDDLMQGLSTNPQVAQIQGNTSRDVAGINAGVQQQRTLADMLSSQYNTDAQMQAVLQQGPNQLAQGLAASIPPAQASMFGTNTNAIAGQNIAQMGNEAKAWGLAQMLGAVSPLLQNQQQFQPYGISADNGAGVNYAI